LKIDGGRIELQKALVKKNTKGSTSFILRGRENPRKVKGQGLERRMSGLFHQKREKGDESLVTSKKLVSMRA